MYKLIKTATELWNCALFFFSFFPSTCQREREKTKQKCPQKLDTSVHVGQHEVVWMPVQTASSYNYLPSFSPMLNIAINPFTAMMSLENDL